MKYNKFRFDEITLNYDKKRIPLSAMERTKRQGAFRYFGAQGVIDYVDDYIFDGKYLLIAEDGENLKSKRQNIAQIVEGKFWVNNHAHIVQCNDKCILEYLAYLINGKDVSGYITGSAQPKLSQANLNAMEFDIPLIKEQQDILSILLPIEQKIRINKEINNNLEQQAKAIFSNEFLTLETLPDGWKQASLIDIADYLNGLAMQKYRPTVDETGIPVLKIKELRQGCCDDNSELCSPSIKSEYIIHDGDVIFSWSGSLLVDFWCGGICGLNQHLFKVTSNKYNKWFYYAWTKHHLDRFIAVAADKATTMGHIKRDELSKAEVLIPNEADYKRIETLLQPIYDLIIANRIENKKLAETRDTLLPKLMSGELDVSDIEL